MISKLLGLVLILSLTVISCKTAQQSSQIGKITEVEKNPVFLSLEGDTLQRVEKTEEDWMAQLDELEYQVLRQAGTERAFTGAYWDNKKQGIYSCRACQLPLFTSETKFVSLSGWPSFYEPLRKGHVKEIEDLSHGMVRTEVVCARCDGHLGHVFDDGPRPTGMRYCMNSVSLTFEENDKGKKKD